MIKEIPKLLLLLLLLVFFQVFVLNSITISGYINPYVYVLFILLLPFDTPGWVLLLVSFALGLIIDSFMNTLGMHSSATLFMGFVRFYTINFLSVKDDLGGRGFLSVSNLGLPWSIRYTLILVFAHHFCLFYLESFTFIGFFFTLWRVLLSTLVTSFFIILLQLFFVSKVKKGLKT
jgi:hypothetical protein